VDGGSGLDAVVAPGIDAADDPEASGGCNGRLDCERTVFITKEAFTGDLGGIERADDKCNAAADASALASVRGRQYRAFLSDTTTSVAARMPHGTRAYNLPTGDVVQRSWNELLTGPLLTAINVAEDGRQPGTLVVWTGSDTDGSIRGQENCDSWTYGRDAGYAVVGSGSVTTPKWIFAEGHECSVPAHLYCFEY
jgi:hypothetical protein